MAEQSYQCPCCGNTLLPTTTEYGLCYICPSCQGKMASLYVVKRYLQNEQLAKQIWRDLLEPRYTPRSCPVCKNQLALSDPERKGQKLEVCKNCQMIWFAPGEFEKLSQPIAPTPTISPDKQKIADQAFAMYMVEHHEELHNPLNPDSIIDTDITIGKVALGVMGLPVEEDRYGIKSESNRKPWVTWSLSALMVFIYIFTFLDDPYYTLYNWGFIPSEWYRNGGLTIFTSMFLHAGLWHLIGNIYFFVVFGDNVERHLGWLKYLALLFGAHFYGILIDYFIHMHAIMPSVGASAGISGILAYYTLMFPKNKVSVLVYRFIWKLPVTVAFGFWVINNIIMIFTEPLVGAVAHLAGAFLGFMVAVVKKMSTSATDNNKAAPFYNGP